MRYGHNNEGRGLRKVCRQPIMIEIAAACSAGNASSNNSVVTSRVMEYLDRSAHLI